MGIGQHPANVVCAARGPTAGTAVPFGKDHSLDKMSKSHPVEIGLVLALGAAGGGQLPRMLRLQHARWHHCWGLTHMALKLCMLPNETA